MAQRIAEVTSAYPWLVFEADDQIAGYAFASRWVDVAYWQIIL